MCSAFRTRFLIPAAALCLSGLLLVNPAAAAAGFSQGVALCVRTLLPALFPFFVTCNLVIRTCGRKNSFGTALFLSWLGGYAVCAGMVHDLSVRGQISPRRAQLLLLLGCCSGPGFVIGSVGGQMLGSVRLGFFLYVAQLAANLVCVPVFLPLVSGLSTNLPEQAASSGSAVSISLSSAITAAVNSCLCVCGSVIFFRMVYALLSECPPLFFWQRACISAFLEISAGCADFAQLGSPVALPGICVCMSMLSVSVFTQLHAILQGAASLRLLLLARLIHLPLLLLFVRLGTGLLPAEMAVFSSLAPRVIPASRVSPDAAFVVFLFLCAVLYKIRKKNYNKPIHR